MLIETAYSNFLHGSNRPISIHQNSVEDNRPQYDTMGTNCRVRGVYSPEPRAEVYCVRLNFNISKLVHFRCINLMNY